MAELTGYQRQCDVQVSRGDYCKLVLGHQAPCDADELPTPVGECYQCWAAPRYQLDSKVQRHAQEHRVIAAQRRYTVTCNTDAPDVVYGSFAEAKVAAEKLVCAEFGRAEITWHRVDDRPEPGSVTHVSACRDQWTGIWVVDGPAVGALIALPEAHAERLGEPEVTHAPPASTCAVCGGGIWFQDCPTGGWWIHNQHPADNHDATQEVPSER